MIIWKKGCVEEWMCGNGCVEEWMIERVDLWKNRLVGEWMCEKLMCGIKICVDE